MPDAYEIHDAQFVQMNFNNSAANGLVVASDPAVPAGKVWNVLQAYCYSTIAETQDYWFAVYRHGHAFPVTSVESASTDTATDKYFPALREGMELKLFPGDTLRAYRDAAAVGSVFYIFLSFIETDLPFYEYIEPQEAKRLFKARSTVLKRMAGGAASSPGSRIERIAPGGRRRENV